MSNFVLVRHGEDMRKSEIDLVRHGSIDTHLTATGFLQAYSIAERLGSFDVKHVHTPPLNRTLSTGRILAQKAGADVIVDETISGRNRSEEHTSELQSH